MNMKKKLLPLSILALILSSCGGGTPTTSQDPTSLDPTSVEPTTVEPTSEEVTSEEGTSEEIERDLLDFDDFDNVMERYNDMNKLVDGKTITTGDPFILRFDGKYYLYATSGYSRMNCYVSYDLIEWELLGACFTGEGYRPSDGGALYAPEVRYFNGYFYMIFHGSSSGLYVAKSENPGGPFVATRIGDHGEIDESYFIDHNEDIYVYAAAVGLHVYDTNGMEELVGDPFVLPTAKIDGGWTEGPYMLERYGQCYLTYTGTDYRNDTYRVDYVTLDDSGDALDMGKYSARKETLLVHTDEDFGYLGHSMTMLGPDLDSYFIVYHNSYSDRGGYGEGRRFNYSRLSFDGALMKADSVRKGMIQDLYREEYYAEDDSELTPTGNYLLSNISSNNAFSVEYTNIGVGKMIFSYIDDNNYGYIEYTEDNEIIVGAVDNGTSKILKDIELIREYDTEVYHTFRLQYSDGQVSLYFDDIEKIAKESIDYSFKGGKCGYLKNNGFEEILHTSMSNVAHGSSDYKAFHENFNYATGYNRHLSIISRDSGYVEVTSKNDFSRYGGYNFKLAREGDRATYRMVAYNAGYYQIQMRVTNPTIGKNVYLKIDDGQEKLYKIGEFEADYNKKAQDSCIILAEVELSAGPHHISLVCSGDEIVYGELDYVYNVNPDDLELDTRNELSIESFHLRNAATFDNGLLMNAGGKCVGFRSRSDYSNAETEITFDVSDDKVNNSFGLLINCNSFGTHLNDHDWNNSFQGMYLVIKENDFSFEKYDFSTISTLATTYRSFNAGTHTLKIQQINNKFICSFDNQELFTVVANLAYLSGGVGAFAKNANVKVTALSVTI